MLVAAKKTKQGIVPIIVVAFALLFLLTAVHRTENSGKIATGKCYPVEIEHNRNNQQVHWKCIDGSSFWDYRK